MISPTAVPLPSKKLIPSKVLDKTLKALGNLIRGPEVNLLILTNKVHETQLRRHPVLGMIFNAILMVKLEAGVDTVGGTGDLYRTLSVEQRRSVEVKEKNIWNEREGAFAKGNQSTNLFFASV